MSSLIQLTPEEREKFAAWLLQETQSDEQMSKVAEEQGGGGPGMEILAKNLKAKVAAKSMVMRELMNTEEMRVGGGE